MATRWHAKDFEECLTAQRKKFKGRTWYGEHDGADLLFCTGSGWWPLQEQLIEDLFVLGWDGNIHQVKEKFGGLRFYIGAGSDAIYDRIREAERQAAVTCEHCGAPGQLRMGGWLKTLCDKHSDGRPAHSSSVD